MYSQSYPIQRVEGTDTVVVLTKAQASAMNLKFLQMKEGIEIGKREYGELKALADSLMTYSVRNEATLHRTKMNALKAIKQNNAEWWSRMAFVTWAFTVYILSNG